MARIMSITAHPADLVERTGGTVANHIARGDEVMFVSLTTGVVTHAFNVFPVTGEDKLKDVDKVKEMKRQELSRACDVLGVKKWEFLDFPENPMIFDYEQYAKVIGLIREFKPDVVLCPHPTEYGRFDHMDAGRFVVACVDYARADGFDSPLAPHMVKDVFMFYYLDFRTDQLMGNPRHSPGVIVDITDVIKTKSDALMEFNATQVREGVDGLKLRKLFADSVDGNAGYTHGFGYAEQFVRLNVEKGPYLPLS